MPNLKTPLLEEKKNNYSDIQFNIQDAYDKKDEVTSKHLHEINNYNSEEYHKIYGSELLKSLIFGGLDGIITTFAIITSSHATGLSNDKVYTTNAKQKIER